MVRKRAIKTREATKAKHNKATIMAKIEANVRRKVKKYRAKQKRGFLEYQDRNHYLVYKTLKDLCFGVSCPTPPTFHAL